LGALLFADPSGAAEHLEEQMRQIASGLRCPVCQNLSVADSPSEMAQEMRALIVDELRAGKRPEEIRAYFVSKYGEWILLSPTPRGFGLLVWVLPGLGAVVAFGGAAWVLRRWTRPGTSMPRAGAVVDETVLARVRAAAAADDPPVALPPEEARLVEGLRELLFDYRSGKLSTRDYEELQALYEAKAATLVPREAPRGDVGVEASMRPAARPGATRGVWRWATAALFLVGFGVAIGFFLPRSVRLRGEGSPTGDFLTGTRDDVARNGSRNLSALLEQGRQAMEAQDARRAIGLFNRALEMDPDQPTAHTYLGLILHQAGHPEKALQSFERALAREPNSPQALWGKGLVLYEAMGKTAEAIRTWEVLLAQEISKEDRDHVLSVLAQARDRSKGQTAPAQDSTRRRAGTEK
jgi:cytochrome c-type biogenesis protein CcmH